VFKCIVYIGHGCKYAGHAGHGCKYALLAIVAHVKNPCKTI
jgi:hypothetical protein